GFGLEIAGAFDRLPAIRVGPVAGGEKEQGRENSSDSQQCTSLLKWAAMIEGLIRPMISFPRAPWGVKPPPSVMAITLFMLVMSRPTPLRVSLSPVAAPISALPTAAAASPIC